MSDPVIELSGAAFGYGDRTVVSDLDLTVQRGEVVAVLGPNGSGKSCLLYTSPSPRDGLLSRMPSSA